MPRFTRRSHHTARARRLRKTPTEAERRLWQHLRNAQLGASFRRQYPLQGFVVDFYCPAARLAVELDGGQHAHQADADARRTRGLVRHGVTVLRFWNNEVLENPEGVVAAIGTVLAEIGRRSPTLFIGHGNRSKGAFAPAARAIAGGGDAGRDARLDILDVVFGETE